MAPRYCQRGTQDHPPRCSLEAKRRGGTEHIQSLADVVTIPAVEFTLRHLHQRATGVWRGSAGNNVNCLFLLARDFVRVDEATLARIEELRTIILARC